MTIKLAMSGRLGSGKDFVAESVMEELVGDDYVHMSFASPLKDLLDEILTVIRTPQITLVDAVAAVEALNVPQPLAGSLIAISLPEMNTANTARDRTDAIRFALQTLGSGMREAHSETYWVDQFFSSVPADRNVIVTDVRFINEAESLEASDFTLVRLNVDEDTRIRRIVERDGAYNAEQDNHISETQLLDFPFVNTANNDGPIAETVSSIALVLAA